MEPPTYLAKKFPHESDGHIQFDEGPHIYTIDGNSDYMSVTTWNHSHFPHFNADKIIDGGPLKPIKDQYFDSSNSAQEIFHDEDFFFFFIA